MNNIWRIVSAEEAQRISRMANGFYRELIEDSKILLQPTGTPMAVTLSDICKVAGKTFKDNTVWAGFNVEIKKINRQTSHKLVLSSHSPLGVKTYYITKIA